MHTLLNMLLLINWKLTTLYTIFDSRVHLYVVSKNDLLIVITSLMIHFTNTLTIQMILIINVDEGISRLNKFSKKVTLVNTKMYMNY